MANEKMMTSAEAAKMAAEAMAKADEAKKMADEAEKSAADAAAKAEEMKIAAAQANAADKPEADKKAAEATTKADEAKKAADEAKQVATEMMAKAEAAKKTAEEIDVAEAKAAKEAAEKAEAERKLAEANKATDEARALANAAEALIRRQAREMAFMQERMQRMEDEREQEKPTVTKPAAATPLNKNLLLGLLILVLAVLAGYALMTRDSGAQAKPVIADPAIDEGATFNSCINGGAQIRLESQVLDCCRRIKNAGDQEACVVTATNEARPFVPLPPAYRF